MELKIRRQITANYASAAAIIAKLNNVDVDDDHNSNKKRCFGRRKALNKCMDNAKQKWSVKIKFINGVIRNVYIWNFMHKHSTIDIKIVEEVSVRAA